LLERLPPQNIEAEQAVLGAMMLEREALAKVVDILYPEDFYRESHRLIYGVMQELFAKNEAVDMVTIVEILRRNEKLEQAGGVAYVTALANSVPTAANLVFHARIVEEKSLLRRLINTSTGIASMGYEANEEIAVIMDKDEKDILEVSSRRTSQEFASIKSIIMDVFDRVSELYESKGGVTGLATGFKDFDKLTSGLHPSDLILIAARPSMGKTAFVLNIAQHVAVRERQPVAFFSLEMSKEQLVQRLLCAESPIDAQRLRIGELENKDWEKLVKAAERLSSAPIFLDDTPGITVMEMRSKARKLKIEHGLKLIIIDYLQLMQGGSGSSRSENRQQEISEISRFLKGLARELKVPVIALSQLSRSVESRQVKRPLLSDLRESGSLEQDADIVAFLYREDYYDAETENKNITDIIIAKHRNGPIDTVKLFFHKQFTKFSDLSRAQQ
jgi:replicative DNA helicase